MRRMARLAKAILRPFYKAFLEKPLWWFLAILKSFFFHEINIQLQEIRQDHARIIAALNDRMGELEAKNAAQWDALEQLILALNRQPRLEVFQSAHAAIAGPHQHLRADAASNLR